jgi:iron complex outermembrane receptor protein
MVESLVITDTRDLARIVPNFQANPGTGQGTANSYSLRGLYNHDTIPTFDTPVGTYVDEFFIQRQNANNFALFDLDRVEVLRGPQGLLFGRNTTGGAVRVILKKPAEELGGWVQAGIGRFDLQTLRGSIDLPLNEKFLTKFTAYWQEDDGYVTNLTTGETGLNDDDALGLRAAVRWMPTDAITWDLGINYIDNEHANMVQVVDSTSGNRVTVTGLTRGITVYQDWLENRKANFGLGEDVESTHYMSNLQWDTNFGTVSFLTAFYDMEQHFMLDFFEGANPEGGFVIANDGIHEQFTQEIKLSGTTANQKIDYTTGFYYFDEDNHLDISQIFGFLSEGATGFPGGIPGWITYDRIMVNGTQSWAVYGQVDWHVSDKWTLTVGARYTDEEDTFGVTDNGNPEVVAPFDSSDMAALGIPLSVDETQTTPRFAIQYQQTDDLMWYASATNGFKSGGWNARGIGAADLQPFDIEQNWSYELGMRSEWWDNRLRVNLTGFFTEIEDYQVPNGVTLPNGGIAFLTTNRSGLETKGIEAEVTLVPVEGLTLFANYGNLDSEYVDIEQSVLDQQAACQADPGPQNPACDAGIVDVNGDFISGELARDYQFTIGASYDWAITNNLRLVPAAHYSKYGDQAPGTDADATFVGGYEFVGASLMLENVQSDWSLTATCWDCTKVERISGAFGNQVRSAAPWVWTLNFRKNF